MERDLKNKYLLLQVDYNLIEVLQYSLREVLQYSLIEVKS